MATTKSSPAHRTLLALNAALVAALLLLSPAAAWAICETEGGDVDGDTVCGNVDNCRNASNVGQADGDADGIGDACDACPGDPDNDLDGDGLCGDDEVGVYGTNPGIADSDGGGTPDRARSTAAAPTRPGSSS